MWSVGFALVRWAGTLFPGWLLPGGACHSLAPDVCGLGMPGLLGFFPPNSSLGREKREDSSRLRYPPPPLGLEGASCACHALSSHL